MIFGSSASKFLFLPLLEMLKKFEGVRRKLGLPRMLLPSWRSTPTEILPNAELGKEEFYLPIIQTGKWLSRQVSKYNILIIIFNFLIEVPFQMFIEFLEQWRTFLREKREEVH